MTRRRRDIVDMVGQRYGRLVVRALAPRVLNGNHEASWVCDCDCGKSMVARRSRLLDGTKRSCRCLQQETRAARTSSTPSPPPYRLMEKVSMTELESWNTIIAAGWGPACAASGVLLTLREYPNIEHARWYWARLREMSGAWADDPANAPLVNESFAPTVLRRLWELLTPSERKLLG